MDNIFVVSDLHLGGRPHEIVDVTNHVGSQICQSYRHLTEFIDWLPSGSEPNSSVELVLNGDIVDFLLDDSDGENFVPRPWSANENEVIEKLDRIVKRTRDDNGRGPFEALRDFLANGHALTMILGNHDVELSLPSVRRHLEMLLGIDHRLARFRFIYDGEAYVRGDLLIEHGNRYDRFNVIDHSALRQERSAMSRKLPLEQADRKTGLFTPPVGSVLVTEVFNSLKREFRFLDLLKPETGAVLPLLLALHPNLSAILSAIVTFGKITPRLATSGLDGPAMPKQDGQLAASSSGQFSTLADILAQELGNDAELFHALGGGGGQLSAESLWGNIKELSANIGKWLTNQNNLFVAIGSDNQRRRQLLVALRKLRNDISFNPASEQPEYLDAATAIAKEGGFSTVIFGHTHLPKQIDKPATKERSFRYINTGTWADVIQIPEALLCDGPDTEALLNAFIDAMRDSKLHGYVGRYLSYAEVVLEGERVQKAELYSYAGYANPRSPLTLFTTTPL